MGRIPLLLYSGYTARLQLVVYRPVIIVSGIRRGRATVQLNRNGVGDVLNFLEFLLWVISGSWPTLGASRFSCLLDSVKQRHFIIGVQFAAETVRATKLGLEAVDLRRE